MFVPDYSEDWPRLNFLSLRFLACSVCLQSPLLQSSSCFLTDSLRFLLRLSDGFSYDCFSLYDERTLSFCTKARKALRALSKLFPYTLTSRGWACTASMCEYLSLTTTGCVSPPLGAFL